MRGPALGERAPLLDAEAVLLVDDRDSEVAELDLLLDERVRPDQDLRVARSCELADERMLLGRERAGEQRHPSAERGADRLDRQEVLLGQHLGRDHQRALAPRLGGPEQRVEGHDRLAGADVPLQQPLHRHGPREICVDLRDRLLLRRRERGRQNLAVGNRQLGGRRQCRGDERLAFSSTARERELEHEELVEGEPPPSLFGLRRRAREMHGDECVAAQRQAESREELGGQWLAVVSGAFQRRRHEAAELLLAQLLARRVDGREVGGVVRLAEVVRVDREAEAVLASAEAHVRAGDQLLLEPGLVEPGCADLAGLVGDVRRQDVEPAATPTRRPAHDHLDHRLLVAEQIDDPSLRDRLLVPARPVREEVSDREQTELRQTPLRRRADPGKRLHGEGERLGSRRRAWPRPALRRVHTTEARRLPGSHHRRQRHLELEYRSRPGLRPTRDYDVRSSSWNQKKPTAPGPACVPTTAPSVSTSSISACGRALRTKSVSTSTHSGAFA